MNEISVLVSTVLLLTFTEAAGSPEVRFKYGWVFLSLVGLTVMSNFVILITNSIIVCKRQRKIRLEKLEVYQA